MENCYFYDFPMCATLARPNHSKDFTLVIEKKRSGKVCMITKEIKKSITEHMLQILEDITHVMTSDLIDTTKK